MCDVLPCAHEVFICLSDYLLDARGTSVYGVDGSSVGVYIGASV